MSNSRNYNNNKELISKIRGLSLADVLPVYLSDYKRTAGKFDIANSPFTDDDTASHFRVDKTNNTWTDFAMTDSKYHYGDLIGFVQLYFNLNFLQAVEKIATDFQDQLKGAKVQFAKPDKKPERPDIIKNAAYQCLIKISFLTKADRRVLHEKRHLTDKEISKYQLFSMPAPTEAYRAKLRAVVASKGQVPETKSEETAWLNKYGKNSKELFKQMFKIFAEVPGFYVQNGEITWTRLDGLAIPVKTFGYVTGIQIRLRNPKQGMARYIWFSSSNKYYGASAGSPICLFDSQEQCKDESKWNPLIITEGFFKGLQYHKQFKTAKVAALPGVGNFKDLNEKVINRYLGKKDSYSPYKPDHIIIGYDADSLVNKQVLEQEIRLYKSVKQYGLPVYVIYWNLNEGKGFDDLVFNHPSDYSKYLYVESFEKFIMHFVKKGKKN